MQNAAGAAQRHSVDIFNFAKAVEQGIYDLMLWVFFYPWTLLRMFFAPHRMLDYVVEESGKNPDEAFSAAMRPALFLFISIAIGSLIAPLAPEQVAELQQNPVGKAVTASWLSLLFFRMVAFSFFPLVAAVMLDALTPGRITRDTLRVPFHLQCYVCAPFALIASPALVNIEGNDDTLLIVTLVMLVWFLVVQFIYFRKFGGMPWFFALLLSPAAFLGGFFAISLFGRVALG
jgi:hypothetical protein